MSIAPDQPSLSQTARESGRPLYAVVKAEVMRRIGDGTFAAGDRLPSTSQISEQLGVSLVTAHRAMQELVNEGVLRRSQGRGTFVDDRYRERMSLQAKGRIGIVLHDEASLADYYHGHLLEGVRQAAHKLHVDLVLLRFGEDVRGECEGFLYINPLPGELTEGAGEQNRRRAVVVVGAESELDGVASVDTDNRDLAGRAARHLIDLGHERLGFLGDHDGVSNSRDRWLGFRDACVDAGLDEPADLVTTESWRLSPAERRRLVKKLRAEDRPTAIFAVGYYFALDVYDAAREAGLSIPGDLSVVGVDDPPSAGFLSPPLTVLRQPLQQLGEDALALAMKLTSNESDPEHRTLRAEWIERGSTGRAPAGG